MKAMTRKRRKNKTQYAYDTPILRFKLFLVPNSPAFRWRDLEPHDPVFLRIGLSLDFGGPHTSGGGLGTHRMKDHLRKTARLFSCGLVLFHLNTETNPPKLLK
jgi:hypothetical protein